MTFRINLRTEISSVAVTQELNLGEGGNELFIEHEQVIRKSPNFTERMTRNAFGKQKLAVDVTKPTINPAFNLKPTSVAPEYEDGQSLLKDIAGLELDRWQFLNLSPDAMGQPVPQQRASDRVRLARNGANIEEYLNEIRKLDPDAFDGILESLRYVLPYLEV